MGHDASHGSSYYVKIWAILVVLFIISVLGPETGIQWVVLVTAFGIAVVKAGMVAAYFMHLNIERKYIWGLLTSALIFLIGLFIGVAPDVMQNHGVQWRKCNSFNAENRARFEREAQIVKDHGHDPSPVTFNSLEDCTNQRF